MAKRKRTQIQNQQPSKHLSYDVSIIIPVLGQFDLLRKCIDSIPDSAGKYKYQIIIFDNGSPEDEAREFYNLLNLRTTSRVSKYGNLILISNRNNVGFPRACNRSAELAKSPLLFFLNSDVVLHKNSLEILIDEMNSDPKIGVMGMKLIFPPDNENDPIRPAGKVQHVGLFTDANANIVHTFIGWSPDHPKVNRVRKAYAITGAALLTRQSLWRTIGGFHEAYGLGTFEDVDYCLSVQELGYNCIVNPLATAYHFVGATAQATQLSYPLQMNRLIFLQRWGGRLKYTEWEVL